MKYNIIYADPPWSYMSVRGISRNGLKPNYPTLTTNEICALPVATIAAHHAVLFLWATDAVMPHALKVIKAWGFRYATIAFVWSKTRKDGSPRLMWGSWTFKNSEVCLLATKGNPHSLFRTRHMVPQLIQAPVTRHSAKPAETRDRIVRILGPLPRVELFAREKVDGWDVWGNEVRSDIRLGRSHSRVAPSQAEPRSRP